MTDNFELQLAASAFLFDDAGRLLVVRRSEGQAGAGLWSVPGGKVMPGEALRQAVVREVLEETGCHIVAHEVLDVVEWYQPPKHYVIVAYLAHATDTTQLSAASDAADAQWVTLAELASRPVTPGLLPLAMMAWRRAQETATSA